MTDPTPAFQPVLDDGDSTGLEGRARTWPAGIDGGPDFDRALALVEAREPFVFVTGKAGTGKSTFLRALKDVSGRSLAVVAPTGVAALNAGGQTIHSFFRLRPGPIDLDSITRVRRAKIYQNLDLLLIDEISMVRADLLDAIDKFLRVNGPDRQRPFGGVPVVAVGDLRQLPPIVSDPAEERLFSEWYETEYFFSAHCLHGLEIAAVELTHVYRQRDALFLRLLNNIRDGNDVAATIEEVNRRCLRPASPEDRDAVTLTCTNAAADDINGTRMRGLPGQARVYDGHVEGQFDVHRNPPAPLRLALKSGAQVMFTRNDPMRRWVNGDLGCVRDMGDETVHVELLESGIVVEVEPAEWESVRYVYDERDAKVRAEPVGVYRQLPITPAWAVTIHKSQGKTLSRVVIDVGRGAFANGQVYVALSRCRTLAGTRLARPLRSSDILSDERVTRFHRAIGAQG